MKILKCFYYDIGSSTALILHSCCFCYDSCRFDQMLNRAESPSSGMGCGGGGSKDEIA